MTTDLGTPAHAPASARHRSDPQRTAHRISRSVTPMADVVDPTEVICVARGIATAVAPEEGITDTQAMILNAITNALTDTDVDYHHLEPFSPDELAAVLAPHELAYRQRIVHHMVLGELVLKPLPTEVAHRVARVCARARRRRPLRARRPPLRAGRVRHGVEGPPPQRLRRPREGGRRQPPARGHPGHRPVRVAGPRSGARGALGRIPRAARRHARPLRGRDVRRPWVRAARLARRCVGLPRPARLQPRARRLRHQPEGRARGVRVRRTCRSRTEGLRVARHAHRPVRDGLRRRHRVLHARRPGAQPSGPGHAAPPGRRHRARQGRRRAVRHRPVRGRLPRAARTCTSTRCARNCASARSRRRLSQGTRPDCSTATGCRSRSSSTSTSTRARRERPGARLQPGDLAPHRPRRRDRRA